MRRTTIMLPDKLRHNASRRAKARSMSLGAFIRSCMQAQIDAEGGDEQDPLFADTATYKDSGPANISERLDDYLYGDEE
ncbi:MAG: hypothetical protein ABFD92_03675 [Planctomycetaceae bacterium]|nr:hypothetical protein [Planctomycetaceae bacterium]